MFKALKRIILGQSASEKSQDESAFPGLARSAYRDLLGREPGQAEILALGERLRQGVSLESLLLEIARSEEFRTRHAWDGQRFQQDDDILSDAAFARIYGQCKAFTMTSMYNMYALYTITKHVATHRVQGDLVECGVWRGGSSMLAAMTLVHLGDTGRRIYLYDTFDGMTRPSGQDVRHDGTMAEPIWRERMVDEKSTWAFASLEDVTDNMKATGFPMANVVFVRGRVEETIPAVVPEKIAMLRLDTDWHESTVHELTHLFPLLQRGGGIIIDDYGWWKGCRKAVDEYFSKSTTPMLLHRICPSGARAGIKA